MERIDPGTDINVLDGVSLVMGSAIASVHILRLIRSEFTGAGWVMVWITFALVAVTATGPFIFLARRFSRRLPGYPEDRRPPVGPAGPPLAGHRDHPVGPARPGSPQQPSLRGDARRRPGDRLRDRAGGRLGDLGDGPAGAGGARRGRPLDESRRPDPLHRLADSVRAGYGGPELKPPRPMAVEGPAFLVLHFSGRGRRGRP